VSLTLSQHQANCLGRGCEAPNVGGSGLTLVFAGIPSIEAQLLPFPLKLAVARNPQKRVRKGQRGRGESNN
jgi:hypothetical protein